GKVLWQKVVLKAPLERAHRLNSRASSTPCSDGERIFLSFLDKKQMFVAAYDLDGNKLWEVRPGVFSSIQGYCSSPVLWKDKVIVNGDHDGPGYLVALDKKTGKTLWKTDRPNNTRSYCTPLLRTIGGRNQMILSGSLCVASYDPDTGKQHWISDGPTQQFVASLAYNGDLLFMTCGFPKRFMQAIRPNGFGNVTKTHLAWQTTKGCSYVPSPIAVGPYFVVVADNGVASCFVAKTGERLWMERLKGGHSASLLTANGLVYFLSDHGVMTIVKPGPEFKVVAENVVGENTFATPAFSEGRLYLRGVNHLFCIDD
ncbi:MAG: PQQ-binding-like beta-propeller repeat protein, partial [Opitutales bacterium]